MNIFNSLGSNYNFNFVLKSFLSFGNSTKKLETILEEKYNGKAILLYKGREAIELSLKQLNLPSGSFVAICGFTCFAVYEAIKNAGLDIEYLDIERGELNFSTNELEKHLKENPKIKVVIIQNTLGYPTDIQNISKVCKDNNITLIEDLAHCVGTKYSNGTEAGTVGDITILSFSQDKIVDGISGGALIKRSGEVDLHLQNVSIKRQIKDRFYPLFTFIIRKSYSFGIGKILHLILKRLKLLSGPMDELKDELHRLPTFHSNLISQAFSNLPENLSHRRSIASIYEKLINPKVVSQKIASQIYLSTNLRFPIFVTERDNLVKYLKQFGIYISDIWYDGPIAPKKYLSQTDYKKQCPNSELASSAILNLPTHINISEKEAMVLSNLINQWIKLQ